MCHAVAIRLVVVKELPDLLVLLDVTILAVQCPQRPGDTGGREALCGTECSQC